MQTSQAQVEERNSKSKADRVWDDQRLGRGEGVHLVRGGDVHSCSGIPYTSLERRADRSIEQQGVEVVLRDCKAWTICR